MTVTFGAACTIKAIIVTEIQGCLALDVHTGQTQDAPGTGTDVVSSGVVAPNKNTSIVIGYTRNRTSNGAAPAAGTGFTSTVTAWAFGTGINGMRSENKRVFTNSLVDGSFTAGVGTDNWVTFVIVYTESRNDSGFVGISI